MKIEHLIPGLERLPVDNCPTPTPAPIHEADEIVIEAAMAQGLRLTTRSVGMLHVLPPFDDSVAEAAKLMGCWCRRVELANWLAGYEKHRWWAVENAAAPE